ncbi:hypothetical protein [Kitasatospora sp. NPDC002040]|uniref:hypothetical protein n=1 Tax=Kitasatospora sp. NPDC002040 TaxID=3154661 RepID=UPI0033284D2B
MTGSLGGVATAGEGFAGALYFAEGTQGVVVATRVGAAAGASAFGERRAPTERQLEVAKDGYQLLLSGQGYPGLNQAARDQLQAKLEREYGFRPDGNDVRGEGLDPAPHGSLEQGARRDVSLTLRVRFDNGLIIDDIDPGYFTEI